MDSIKPCHDMEVSSASENHLNCLGFVVTNGRPRFKMDQSTMVNQAISCNVANENDTLSFEILGKDSLHAIDELSYLSYVDIRQKSKSIDCSVITSTSKANGIENKLMDVLQENAQLKETLKQNNICMKQQFNILAMWQEEVIKIHQSHKQKFAETKDLIHHLKKESAHLKMKLSSIQSADKDNQFKDLTELQRLVQGLVDDSNIHGKQQFIENATQWKEKMKNLTDYFDTHIFRSAHIQENIKDCIDTLEPCSITKCSELLVPEEIKSLRDKISACYKNLLDQQVKMTTDQQRLIKAVNEFKISFLKYNSVLDELETLQEQNIKLNANFNVRNISIHSKEKILEEERNIFESEKQLLLQERINLYQEKASLDQQSQLYESHEKTLQAEKKILEKEHEKLLVKINEFEKDLQMMGALKEQIIDQSEEIEVLKTHLSTHKEDLKRATKSIDSLISEKLELTEQLRRQIEISKESEELIQQLLAQTGQTTSTHLHQHTETFQNTATEQQSRVSSYPVTSHRYSCPICDCTFSSVRSVEEHVGGCLNPE